MIPYKIKSPSGKIIEVIAGSIYHAVELASTIENFVYTNSQYLKLNQDLK